MYCWQQVLSMLFIRFLTLFFPWGLFLLKRVNGILEDVLYLSWLQRLGRVECGHAWNPKLVNLVAGGNFISIILSEMIEGPLEARHRLCGYSSDCKRPSWLQGAQDLTRLTWKLLGICYLGGGGGGGTVRNKLLEHVEGAPLLR